MNRYECPPSVRRLVRSDFPANARFWVKDDEVPLVQDSDGWRSWFGGFPGVLSKGGPPWSLHSETQPVSFEMFAGVIEKSRRPVEGGGKPALDVQPPSSTRQTRRHRVFVADAHMDPDDDAGLKR